MVEITKDWLDEVAEYVKFDCQDNGILSRSVENEIDDIEVYSSRDTYGEEYLTWDVRNMGVCDLDKVNDVLKNLGKDIDAYDYADDVYQITQDDIEIFYRELDEKIDLDIFVLGRMGGHWGVKCEDVVSSDDYVKIIINENKLMDFLKKEYDLDEIEDIWDIDCQEIADLIFDDKNIVEIEWDKNFIKTMNNIWKDIKNASDYMYSKDYAEYIAEIISE